MLLATCWSMADETLADATLGAGAADGAFSGFPDFAGFAGGGAAASSSMPRTTTCLRLTRRAPMAKRAARPAKMYHLKSSRRLGAAMTSGPCGTREFPSWDAPWPWPESAGGGEGIQERLTERMVFAGRGG